MALVARLLAPGTERDAMTNLEILEACFKALPKADRRRLKYHLDNNTPIFCGNGSDRAFFNGKGFA